MDNNTNNIITSLHFFAAGFATNSLIFQAPNGQFTFLLFLLIIANLHMGFKRLSQK